MVEICAERIGIVEKGGGAVSYEIHLVFGKNYVGC